MSARQEATIIEQARTIARMDEALGQLAAKAQELAVENEALKAGLSKALSDSLDLALADDLA